MGATVRGSHGVSLYVVGEEAPARYDANHTATTPGMDDVNECVATLGMAAFGLYNYLEKVVDETGTKRVSVTELAATFQQSERYVQEALTKLVDAGWVERVQQANRFGMQMANLWRLPYHKNVRTDGGEPRGEPRGEPQPQSEFTPLYTLTTGDTERRENGKKEITRGVQGGTKKRTPYTPEFEAFWRAYPTGHGVKTLAFGEWQKLTEDERTAAVAALPAWAASQKWTDGFIRDCERWLKYREFEQTPTPSKRLVPDAPKGELIVNGKAYKRRGWVE